MAHYLNGFDEILVLKTCSQCHGTKEVKDAAANTSPCTTCDDRGKMIQPVSLREVAEFVAEYMADQIRLQGGLRR